MLKRMTIDEIRAALLDMAKDREAMINGEMDSIWAHDAQALYEAAELIDNSVPRDFHDHCMGLAINRYIDAELKLEQAQATNRQILENYVPKDDCRWHDVEKESPTKNGMYLAISCSNNGRFYHTFAIFDVDGGWTYGTKLAYWMPLPEMPKEAEP